MEEDERLRYIYRQVSAAFKHISSDRIAGAFTQDSQRRMLLDFLNNPDTEALFFKDAKSSVEVLDHPPKGNKTHTFYVVKLTKKRVSDQNYANEIVYGDVTADPLDHMASLMQGVFQPIVKSKDALGQSSSESILKDIRTCFDGFVANIQITQGHVRGITCLPMPSGTGSKDEITLEGFDDLDQQTQQSHIHILEGAIITWTKQIKNILKRDPETVLQDEKNPGPLAEVDFWNSKALNLNGIFAQLQSDKVRRILKVLDKSKSTYNAPFAKLCKEVFYARSEANNIIKYLRPLVPWFEGLENEPDFEKLTSYFKPIIHVILLIWKSSAYYNTPARIVVLFREIGNTLVKRACNYLNGDTIFDYIEANEASQAQKFLQTILYVLGRFKTVYFDYKAKSTTECPENPWRIQNNALFVRLDSFLERCHDVLDMVQTILQFGRLGKIEVGGTKGKSLTTSIAQIFVDFQFSVSLIKEAGKGILDLDNKVFDDAFYDFRSRMKELDRRLSGIIIQGFDDAGTIGHKLRILDTFDGLISRPVIADQLEKKHAAFIAAVRFDLDEVQRIFHSFKHCPPVGSNLPPIAGSLTWCRGLLERVQPPLEKLKHLDKKILERDDTREVLRMYSHFLSQLAEFERDNIETWGKSIEASSQEKLKNPLLRRLTTEEAGNGPLLLRVNFDPLLVQLLREVKYFLLLGLQVPPAAMEIYQRAEIFRRHTGNLDLIVNMYNDVQTSLLPVERPLVRAQMERVDRSLAQGIGDGKMKSKGLNWKSNGIEVFIGEAMTEANEITEVLQVLKGNLKRIEVFVSVWEQAPLFERSPKTMLAVDFASVQKSTRQARIMVVKENGQDIHRLLKDTNKRLKVSQGLPDWKAYVDFVNNIVVAGLIKAMESSVRYMATQLNPKYIEQNNILPLFEIQVDLFEKEIVCIPRTTYVPGNTNPTASVHNLVHSWINGMLGLGQAFKRLDGVEGSYVRELGDAFEVQTQIARATAYLTRAQVLAADVCKIFQKFEFLWQIDVHDTFAKFLKEAVVVEEVPFAIDSSSATDSGTNGDSDAAEHPESKVRDQGTWKKVTINLDMFHEKIQYFLGVQSEVSDCKSVYDIDFLRLNAIPAKQAISAWVTKWLYCYSHYLLNFIGNNLVDLFDFLKRINTGLDLLGESNGRDVIITIMTQIRDVRKRMPEIESIFEPLRNTVKLLKKHSIPIDLPPVGKMSALEFLEAAQMLWDNAVNKTFRVKEEIQQLQNVMMEGIKKDVNAFEQNLARVASSFRSSGPFGWVSGKEQIEVYVQLDRYQQQLAKLNETASSLRELEDLFELPISKHSLLADMKDNLRVLKGVWDVVRLVDCLFSQWKLTLWNDIKSEDLMDETRRLQNQIKMLPQVTKDWNVCIKLKAHVQNMSTLLPLVHELQSPAIRDRHWKSILILAGNSNFEKDSSFCLEDLINLNLHGHVEAVLEIVEVANKELKIEAKLTSIEDIWKRLSLDFVRHRDTDVFVVSPPDDILDALEEHSLQLQGMIGLGMFVDFFRDKVVYWQTTLGNVESVIKILLAVQRQWGSLESIFMSSVDIRTQLPEDAKRFEGIDTEFKDFLREIGSIPSIIECCAGEGREQALQGMFKELEKCEKALNDYLEVKKTMFPRFYFISNATLLDILSNGTNPSKITPHIGSVFDGIGDLDLCHSKNQQDIMAQPDYIAGSIAVFEAAKAMISKDRERVDFHALFEMNGAVEMWLTDLVEFMRQTLRLILVECLQDAQLWEIEKPREEWIFLYPAQLALLTTQVVWTEEVETSLEELEGGQEYSMKQYLELSNHRLESLIRLVQGPLEKGDRVKIITVITIDVHNRDVVAGLVKSRVESNSDFKWQSQLRYMYSPDDNAVNIRICDFHTLYSFEYIGNCGRLVITPLTDRCYVTLTVALKLTLGGAPAGPAGTGKTETTKDLARGLGLPCYVFNCSDQMNYRTMADIFKGLTQVGAWGCFDEFNRIEIEVLSVVASQVQLILDAVAFHLVPANRDKKYQMLPAGAPPVKVGTFNFFGEQISLVPTVGLFITMNPGYAGRTELPENLKALFRSCAMIRPDLEPIAENMLMAEGFVRARPLSVKFIALYKLLSELLSKQHHYDWGLRAVKSVLRVAGMLKRSEPTLDEEAIMMRALRDFNTPKIPSNDIPIFLRLISDLFPGLDLPPNVNNTLESLCGDVCKATNLQCDISFTSKVVQFEEILQVRHSVMILGPPGCGKTTIWKTLANCHNFGKAKHVTAYETINPKAVTTDELYGYMTLTKDWKDGVLSIVMRNMSRNISPYSNHQTMQWVVLDGDIDAEWIESMNTVMDDNKVLTLVSNERIPLSDAMRMVFEIHSLKNATPATVSRAGILFINDTDIGHQPFVDSWLRSKCANAEKASAILSLPDIFDTYLKFIVDDFVNLKLETVVPLPLINLIQTLCRLLDVQMAQYAGEKSKDIIERMFIYSAMWAFGGSLTMDSKKVDHKVLFSNAFKKIAKCVRFPDLGLVFDYYIDFSTGYIVPWQDKVASFSTASDGGPASTMVVPTSDSVRLTHLLNILTTNGFPVMFVGSAGTGKTTIVSDYLSSLVSRYEMYKYATINMNYYADAASLQVQLEQHIDKRSGKAYGPHSGKLIFFVDDLNLPFIETYGTQTPMELMRQHIDYGSWFDRNDMSLKKQIQDCQYITAMNNKSGSFFVNPRLQRHFATFICQNPSDADLSMIFGTILNGHLINFDPKIQTHAMAITNATIAVHKEIIARFLPSAIKFHYNFTMRELSAVMRGMLWCRPKIYSSPAHLTKLWYHEVMRVYSDRLVSDAEVMRCRNIVLTIGKLHFDDDPEVVFKDSVAFTHFVSDSTKVTTDDRSMYTSISDPAKLKKSLEDLLQSHNETSSIMNLVLFDQAIQHIVRICRILKFPGGNAMLVGVGGSGKQSLTKLSAFICQYKIFQLPVSSGFTILDLKENLKELYRKTGVKPAEPIVLMLTDAQIVDEKFLVYINDLLSSGRIPDLFAKEEYDGIFASLRNQAKSDGIPDNRDSMMKYFIGRVRVNLHVVLCFSPVGELFRQRARRFPGIVSCSTIDWFHEWPKDALVSVAQRFLESLEVESAKADLKDCLANHMAVVHSTVAAASKEYLKVEKRFNYTTPKSFLELIDFYRNLFIARKNEMKANIKRLDTGLETLQRTNHDVAQLQEFLKVKKKEVEAKKAATDALLDEMGEQRAEAQAQQEVADVEKSKADAAALEARELERQAEGDLAIARPALEAANEAVKCLDKASLTELKSFAKPPAGVDKVTSALLIMIKDEKRDFSWENAKKMMAKVDAFKERLETYRGEDIPEDVIERVKPFMDNPEFTFEKMKTKSAAAANLCNWVINIVTFNGVYKRVKPLMDALEVAAQSKQKAEGDLAVVKEQLAAIEGKLSKLQASFMAATEEKAKVEKEAKECLDRLSLAERLTNGLSSENERWTATVQQLKKSDVTLPGDVMLAASFVSYIGAFGANFRQYLWKDEWLPDLVKRDIALTPNIDPLKLLADDSTIAEWQNQSLPADRISVENGAILTNCNRWPLLIDPQLQGIRWLKQYAANAVSKTGKALQLVRLGEKKWMSRVIAAIQAGDTVIIENIGETIDSSLEPVLSKSVYRKGKSMFIKIGDEDIQYDESFSLYLQTKLSNPHYKPEIAAQCTLINFIVTRKGLEDQLLASVVSEEEPDIERRRNELVKAFNSYKIQLKELEDLLLERLANAPVDILSDIALIEGLEATKEKAMEINAAVEEGKETEIIINAARDVYRVIATEGSITYFVMLQLVNVNHMYQYSLDSFNQFFYKALKEAAASHDKATRVTNLQFMMRWTVYKWVVRGLFEKQKLIYLTQLTINLLQNNIFGEDTGFSHGALRVLLLGASGGTELAVSSLPWLSDTVWSGIKNLSTLEGFEKLPRDMEENPGRFLEWFQHYTPESEKLPLDWRELDKTPFRKLLVVRVLRPDRLTAALTNFIRDLLPRGKDFIECDSQLSAFQILHQCFEDSSPCIPLYFILSPGADFGSDVDKLATKYGKTKGIDYHNISLGQGQDGIAQERLDVGQHAGHWIVLNNVHLMPRWLNFLEKRLDFYKEQGTHDDFRIMLSSDPSESIPVSILDRSIKITSDPPSGLRANLKQAFASFSKDTYDDLEPRSRAILFGLCQFHAVMVERKKFGAKGYNMMYPFAVGDLVCSAAVLRNYMESAPQKIPWADLRYLFGEIMYGGHIVNDFDRLLANTYLDFYMRDELLEEMALYPYADKESQDVFKAPPLGLGFEQVVEFVDDSLKTETPLAFGLHPNAEIGFRTQMSEMLLSTILELSTSSSAEAGDVSNSQMVAEVLIQEILETYRDVKFDLFEISRGLEDIGPFQNVVLQECKRMNGLVFEMIRSLSELDLGFRGDLTMTEPMEELASCLFLERVPKSWEALAYPSMRSLGLWLVDLQARLQQLSEWALNPSEPAPVTWISGLFNPQSFITSVLQSSTQASTYGLDKLVLVTEVTKKMAAQDFPSPSRDGAYITGLYLEGASWNPQVSLLEPSKPREMYCQLPVILIRPAYLEKFDSSLFHCPVYKTQMRGPTYVLSMQLRTKHDPAKWILAGVVAVMDVL
jgi:dynein heavy chain